MKSLRDARGKELMVGQMVAVAEREGNVAIIRWGIVSDVNEKDGKVSVYWQDAKRLSKSASTITVRGVVVDRHRMLVLG